MSSATTTQSSRFTSVFHNFSLQWSLSVRELLDLSLQRDSKVSVLQSDVFEIAKDLRFYLELERPETSCYYSISIKGPKTWSFKLDYGFLVNKERAYGLKKSSRLLFLDALYDSCIDAAEAVTIYCVANASLVHPAPSAKEDDLSLWKKGGKTVAFDGTPSFTLPANYKGEEVLAFIRKGDIPDFSVKKAIEIISKTKEHQCEVLKILSVEYLMNNITSGDICQISKASIDYDLPLLERRCVENIAYGWIKTK